MNVLERTTAFLCVLLALTACVPLASGTAGSVEAVPAASAGADEAAIRAGGDSWNNAYNTLNIDALVELYAADAVLMPEAVRSAKGHAAIRKFLLVYAALLTDGGYTPVVANTVEIEVSGNLGFRSGTYSISDKSGAGVDTGKWLETWRRTDGKWQIIRDIWNSDMLPLFPPTVYAAGGGAAE